MLGFMVRLDTRAGKFSAPTVVSDGVCKDGLPVFCTVIKGAMAVTNS